MKLQHIKNVCDATKAMPNGCTAFNESIKKEEWSKINDLKFYFNNLVREQQLKSKANRIKK